MSITGARGATAVSYKPGETAKFVVSLTNNGPGDAPGITVVVTLPSTFHYKSTDNISDAGSARTQPLDARVGSSDPQWGFWDVAAPAAGKKSVVQITFTVEVQGAPDTYNVAARVQGDNTAGTITGKPLAVRVTPAPRLQLAARVDQTSLRAGSVTVYRVTVSNTGSANAANVGLLITLPSVMVFQSSVLPFEGNASRDKPIDPIRGAVEVFYGGYTLPAASSSGPGFVTVAFRALVASRPQTGKYTIAAQVTDDAGDVTRLDNAAAVDVQGISATPSSAP